MNCFCRARYTASVGRAMIKEPAAIRLSLLKNWPPRLAIDEVIGRLAPCVTSTTAQKKSL